MKCKNCGKNVRARNAERMSLIVFPSKLRSLLEWGTYFYFCGQSCLTEWLNK